MTGTASSLRVVAEDGDIQLRCRLWGGVRPQPKVDIDVLYNDDDREAAVETLSQAFDAALKQLSGGM